MSEKLVIELMAAFAESTGLIGTSSPRRYLWTDAFAVCNFLTLHRRTGEHRYLDHARRLIDQVHEMLGRHRDDDISNVMLATSLATEGYVRLDGPGCKRASTIKRKNR